MPFLYDKSQLYDLVKKFNILTGIKAVIYDIDFQQIAAIPERDCPFCETMQQSHSFAEKCNRCVESGAIPCKRDNSLNIYKCHCGLFEVTSPIRINGVLFGYFTIGQIIEKNDKISKRDEILQYASTFTKNNVEALFDALNTKSYQQIEAAAKIMEACIAYILMSNVIQEDKGNIILRINDYIEQNIAGDCSVNTLCETFKISRNALYKISNNFLGMPIAKFIRRKKMDTAAKLIETGSSVSKAAESVGFYDYNYFSKAFKSIKGVSPNQFKRL